MLFCYSQNSYFFILNRRKKNGTKPKLVRHLVKKQKRKKCVCCHSVVLATKFKATIFTIIMYKEILPSSCTPQFKSFKYNPHNRFYGANLSKSHNFYVPQFPICRWGIRKDCNHELVYRKHFSEAEVEIITKYWLFNFYFYI